MAQILSQPQLSPTTLKTGAYTAGYYEIVRCDPSAGGFIVTLPAATGRAGAVVKVINASASTNTITINPTGSETIDGGASDSLTIARQSRRYDSDGTNWFAGAGHTPTSAFVLAGAGGGGLTSPQVMARSLGA